MFWTCQWTSVLQVCGDGVLNIHKNIALLVLVVVLLEESSKFINSLFLKLIFRDYCDKHCTSSFLVPEQKTVLVIYFGPFSITNTVTSVMTIRLNYVMRKPVYKKPNIWNILCNLKQPVPAFFFPFFFSPK